MHIEELTLWIIYIVANLIGLLILWAGIKKPRLARWLFFFLFAWAAGVNYTTANSYPEVYLTYADHSITIYSRFINGWFSKHVSVMVSFIAIGQVLIALGILLKGYWVKLACIGIMIFLIAIAPLGIYAAFPFSITVSLAAFFILLTDDKNFIWLKEQKNGSKLFKVA